MNFVVTFSNVMKRSSHLMGRIPSDLVQFILRLGLAGVFWASARTKVTGFMDISDSTYFLFEEEYQLPLIPVDIAVPLTTYAEHILPLLLVIGLATRLSALGIFVMTLVIQVFVYPSAFMSAHLGWFGMSLAIMSVGSGRWSLDYMISKKAS